MNLGFGSIAGKNHGSGECHSPVNDEAEASGVASLRALLNNIDHGPTSSHRAHLPVIMGYGKPDITVPNQWPTFHQQVEDKFSPYAKEILVKLITFLEVRDALWTQSSFLLTRYFVV
jgi:hypothetical protein